MTLATLLLSPLCLASCLAPDDQAYLRRKWREDLSDPATGLGGAALKAETAAIVSNNLRVAGWPMTKALVFSNLCERTAIDVSPYDWFPTFARWTRHTLDLHPFYNQMLKRRDEVLRTKHPKIRPRWPYWSAYPDFDHSAPDWDDVLKVGFAGMAKRLESNWKDEEYYRVRKVAAAGVLRLIDRFVEQGFKVSKFQGFKVPEFRDRLEKQVESLKRLRVGAPQTTLDALMTIYLYWVISENFEGIQVRTLGNLDRLLAPYYRADLKAGRTTEAEFRDQLRHFWWQWGSIDNYWGQPVYFGGTKADGTSEYNEVSKILLEVHDELALPTPKVHLKMGKSTPDWVWTKALDMSRRMRPISYIGEEPHWRVIRSLGYGETEAREFMLWGCYEWAVRDSANDTFGASVNLLKPIEDLLAAAADGRFAAGDFAAVKEEYVRRVLDSIAGGMDYARAAECELGEINPSLLFSLATPHSVETGRDAYCGGMLHGNNTGIWLVGLGTAVDALSATREILSAGVGLKELGEILAKNWDGHEELRRRMLRSKCKWGNNDPAASELGAELVKRFSAAINGKSNSRGGRFKAHGHTARYHYDFGRATGATPDGRKKGEEISKNVSPTMGADTEGATALVATLANLDARDLPGDFPLDVALLPNTVAGEKGLRAMRALIEQYFANGGLVIQFNIHDAETLKDAQKHPEKYRNLQVRVCGWNVRWNDIPKAEQDKFILRQECIAQ